MLKDIIVFRLYNILLCSGGAVWVYESLKALQINNLQIHSVDLFGISAVKVPFEVSDSDDWLHLICAPHLKDQEAEGDQEEAAAERHAGKDLFGSDSPDSAELDSPLFKGESSG